VTVIIVVVPFSLNFKVLPHHIELFSCLQFEYIMFTLCRIGVLVLVARAPCSVTD